jgi:hypothetical protein
MQKRKRLLLSSVDLKQLYFLTGPSLSPSTQLRIIIREKGKKWFLHKDHMQPLKGYRSAKAGLENGVNHLEQNSLWPEYFDIGIGVIESKTITNALIAINRGSTIKEDYKNGTPLDWILDGIGKTRADFDL